MQGPEDKPLLVLDREGEGRIAVLASDHAWLWSRGYEGGGPQLELLRRLAHWLMKEPELEEEVLRGTGEDGAVTIEPPHPGRERAAGDRDQPVRRPPSESTLTEVVARPLAGPDRGRRERRLAAGERRPAGGGGRRPLRARRSSRTRSRPATSWRRSPTGTRGGVRRLEDGLPDVRLVREGRVAEGRGWIGLADREAYQLRDIRQVDLAPGWLSLILAAGLAFAAWRIEGR